MAVACLVGTLGQCLRKCVRLALVSFDVGFDGPEGFRDGQRIDAEIVRLVEIAKRNLVVLVHASVLPLVVVLDSFGYVLRPRIVMCSPHKAPAGDIPRFGTHGSVGEILVAELKFRSLAVFSWSHVLVDCRFLVKCLIISASSARGRCTRGHRDHRHS